MLILDFRPTIYRNVGCGIFSEKVGAKLILFDIITLEKFDWKEVVLCQQ